MRTFEWPVWQFYYKEGKTNRWLGSMPRDKETQDEAIKVYLEHNTLAPWLSNEYIVAHSTLVNQRQEPRPSWEN